MNAASSPSPSPLYATKLLKLKSMSQRVSTILIFLNFLFTSCFSPLDSIPEPHSLEYKESFEALARDIATQTSLYELDDFTRYHKIINGVSVKIGEAPELIDSLTVQATNRTYKPLNEVLDSLNVDRRLLEDFQRRLKQTKLRSFYKSNDSVLFIVDGFLDDAWGFMYCKSGRKVSLEPFRFGDYTVQLVDSVNKTWSRASIH